MHDTNRRKGSYMSWDILLLGQLEWSIRLLIVLICITALYVFLLNRFTDMKFYHKQPLLFFLGISLLYFMAGSPLYSISHLSFSLHMIQMSILYFIIPPLTLLGIPESMFSQMLEFQKIQKIPRSFFLAKQALYIFAFLFLIYHLPFVLNILSQSPHLQNGYLSLLFILSFGMWWPIASPDPKQRLGKGHMKRYGFLNGLILMPACILFILTALIEAGSNPFLTQMTAHLCLPPQSSSFTLLPPPFNTKYDQIMAGLFMLGLHKFGLLMTFTLKKRV